MLGSPILYLKGMRIVMFQLSGFYSKETPLRKPEEVHQVSPTWGSKNLLF